MDKSWPTRMIARSRHIIVLAFTLILIFGFALAFQYYSTTSRRIGSGQNVFDLRQSGLITRISFESSELCDRNGTKTPCSALPEFNDQAWQQTSLPLKNIRKLEDHAQGLKNQTVSYRMHVDIPEVLRDGKQEIAFTPFYVNHQRYYVYLNGRLVFASDGENLLGRTVVIPIPPEDAMAEKALITLIAKLEVQDEGIQHEAPIYIGPKKYLDEVYVAAERGNATYFLMFIISKGSVFIVFSLIFFFSRRQNAMFWFLMFAVCVTAEDLLQSVLVYGFLDLFQQVVLYFSVKSCAIVFLFLAVSDFLRVNLRGRLVRTFLAAIPLSTVALLTIYSVDPSKISIPNLFTFTNAQLCVAVGAMIAAGIVAILKRRRGMWSDGRNSDYGVLVTSLSVYLCLVIVESFFTEYRGFDKRALYDLGLFYLIAFVTARNFGFNERMISQQVAELSQARVSASIGRAAQMLAHDLRKPLSMFQLFWQSFRNADETHDQIRIARAGIQEIESASTKAEALLEELLEVGRKTQLDIKPVSLNESLAEVVRMIGLSRVSRKDPVEVVFRMRHSFCVKADRRKLHRILHNLIDNAVDAMNQGGIVTVQSLDREGDFEFSIHNPYPVISAQNISQVFDPFFSSGKSNGTGLGLAIVRKLVDEMSGRVSCQSTESQGTRFIVKLPSSEERDLAAQPSTAVLGGIGPVSKSTESAAAKPTPPDLVVVDDNFYVQSLWISNSGGMNVATFSSPESCLNWLRSNPLIRSHVPIFVTDYYFGHASEMNGEEFAIILRDEFKIACLLASDAGFGVENPSVFIGVIAKGPKTLEELRAVNAK